MKGKLTRWGLLVAAGLAAATLLNWAVLEFLGERSPYRSDHGLAGTIFLLVYLWINRGRLRAPGPLPFLLVALLPTYAGTAFPDLDIRLLGIGGHRNPLFHSALSYLALMWPAGRDSHRSGVAGQLDEEPLGRLHGPAGRRGGFLRAALIGYGLGLGSHLLWDVLDYGDVRWLPGGTLDRLWLGANGLMCFVPPWTRRRVAPQP